MTAAKLRPFHLVSSAISLLAAMTGCATLDHDQPVPRAASVNLSRYAGPWYIIGSIPLSLEKGAHDPVETYTINPDGTLATVFQFRKGAFDGELETKPTVARIVPNSNNAEWRVQTIWPFKAQYIVSYLEPDYSAAIVARDKRDHVWILSRTAHLSAERLADYRQRMTAMGYDLSRFEMFPQNGSRPMS